MYLSYPLDIGEPLLGLDHGHDEDVVVDHMTDGCIGESDGVLSHGGDHGQRAVTLSVSFDAVTPA